MKFISSFTVSRGNLWIRCAFSFSFYFLNSLVQFFFSCEILIFFLLHFFFSCEFIFSILCDKCMFFLFIQVLRLRNSELFSLYRPWNLEKFRALLMKERWTWNFKKCWVLLSIYALRLGLIPSSPPIQKLLDLGKCLAHPPSFYIGFGTWRKFQVLIL